MISGLESVFAPKAGREKSARRESAPKMSCGVFTVLTCVPVIRTTPDCEYLSISLSLYLSLPLSLSHWWPLYGDQLSGQYSKEKL